MHPVIVTLRTRDSIIPNFEAQAFAPFAGSPLAVTALRLYDTKAQRWGRGDDGFMIVHVPTGFALGIGMRTDFEISQEVVWDTIPEAMAVLLRADPTFPGWALAKGLQEPATKACHAKFKMALESV